MVVELIYDGATQSTKVQRKASSDPNIPVLSNSGAPVGLDEINYLWSARDELASIADSVITAQRTYDTSASNGRVIYTSFDGLNRSDFPQKTLANPSNFLDHLDVSDLAKAQALVNFIRGKEGITGLRNRTVDHDNDSLTPDIAWRLGDIMHSTPVAVGIPGEGYAVDYRDETYSAFVSQYRNRRNVVYVGANDGMLHAFNAGFWDYSTKTMSEDNSHVPGAGAVTSHPLGAELWAYVPRAALPHLKWLKDPNYPHTFYVDGEPLVFDANIFTPSAKHPYGWGTVLVVGIRFGGADYQVNLGGTPTDLYSSYSIFDITNPEVPPTLIAEISYSYLQFTINKPTVFKKRIRGAGSSFTSPTSNDWYLAFGSGPTDIDTATTTSSSNAHLFIYELVLSSPSVIPNKVSLSVSGGYVGEIAAVD
jgi:type IV pilus assembly protein PilY1